jgi:hypothetical protein
MISRANVMAGGIERKKDNKASGIDSVRNFLAALGLDAMLKIFCYTFPWKYGI